MKILKSSSFTIKKWSGGTTKELYIYPEDSDYMSRNFEIRISTAIVELEKSEFTLLKNYNRHLMILDGEMKIFHEGHYNKKMKKFDVDSFYGGWSTTSEGKVVDFNLMTTINYEGELHYYENFDEIALNSFNLEKKIIYIYKGKYENKTVFETGDIIILDKNEELFLKSLDSTGTIIISDISKI